MKPKLGYALSAGELALAAATLANGAAAAREPSAARAVRFWTLFDVLCTEETEREWHRTNCNRDDYAEQTAARRKP